MPMPKAVYVSSAWPLFFLPKAPENSLFKCSGLPKSFHIHADVGSRLRDQGHFLQCCLHSHWWKSKAKWDQGEEESGRSPGSVCWAEANSWFWWGGQWAHSSSLAPLIDQTALLTDSQTPAHRRALCSGSYIPWDLTEQVLIKTCSRLILG